VLKKFKILENKNILSSFEEQNEYVRLLNAALTASYVIENIGEAKKVLGDRRKFYDFKKCLRAREILEKGLELISCEFYPSRWSFDCYAMRYSRNYTDDILKGMEDEKENIFLEFFRKDILPSILKENPFLVGISITYADQVIPGFTLANLIKKANRNIHLTMGGAYISYFLDTLKTNKKIFSIVDSIIISEGEHALLQLAERVRNRQDLQGVSNIIYNSKGKIFASKSTFVEDINSLPVPCFDGLPLDLYLSPQTVILLAISRGCYWNRCAFCAVSFATRKLYRRRDPHLIIKDIEYLSQRYNTKYFFFSVDAASPKELADLAVLLNKKNIKIYWQCQARLEKGFTKNLCFLIAKAGCRQLIFGLESASQKVLDLMDKGTKVANFRKILRNCYNSNIAINLQYFLGFPGETQEDRKRTFEFISNNTDIIHSVASSENFSLLKGTKVYNNPERYGIVKIYKKKKQDFRLGYDFEMNSQGSLQRRMETVDFNVLDNTTLNIDAHSLLLYSYYNPKNIKKLISKYYTFHTYMNSNYLELKPRIVNTARIKKCKYNYYKINLFLLEEKSQRKGKSSLRYDKQVKNEALRAKDRSFHSPAGVKSLRSRKPFNATVLTAAAGAFIPRLESLGFSAKEDKKNSKNKTAIFLPEETYVIYNKAKVPVFRTNIDLKFLLDLCNGTYTTREVISLLSDKYNPSVTDFAQYPNLIKMLLTEGIISLIK